MKWFEWFTRPALNRVNLLGALFTGIFLLLFAGVVAWEQYREQEAEVARIEAEYFQSQKAAIVSETERALRFIRYKHQKYDGKKPLEELQQEIVDAIEQMRSVRDGTGYIFIYTFDGINIADPILKQNAGKNMLRFEDPTGKKVIAELIDVSQKPEGGFVEYWWNKPIVNKLAPKISYAKAYGPWRWMVGSGVYLDSVREVVAEKRSAYRLRMREFFLTVGMLALGLFAAVALLSHLISRRIGREVRLFTRFFDTAAEDNRLIDKERLRIQEFRQISDRANTMVREIRQKKSALENLNATLEEKVRQKTKKLEAAKVQAEALVEAQDRFIKNAIHEINTPLGIILANIDLLRMRDMGSSHLGKIEAATKVIHNVYSDLAYMVRKDRVEYPAQRIDLGHFVNERLEYFNEVAVGNHLRFQAALAHGAAIWFSPVQLQRLCDNNLSNAIKYSEPGGVIEVTLKVTPEGYALLIQNRGQTIREPERLFERYYREDSARGGFGIGLHLVGEICRANGVRCRVASADGVTTFYYLFKPLEVL